MTDRLIPGARRRGARRVLAATAALALVAAGCGDDGEDASTEGEEVTVVLATTSIWADVVRNLACGGGVVVETVIPPGGDPHAFEPSLADRGRMDEAALVVANGLLLEEALEDTLDASADAGTPVFRVGEHVDTIAYGDAHSDDHDEDHADEDEGDHDEHDHEGDDPHVWFDPMRVSAMLPELGERLTTHAGLSADAVRECIADYQAELTEVDDDISVLVGAVPEDGRLLVTSHDSLSYFADRYGFEVIGTVIPAPSGLGEASPAQLEELAEVIADTGVSAIFAETQHSDDDARALADRVGDVDVVTLFTGTLGDEGSGAETYVGFLRTNAELITEALG